MRLLRHHMTIYQPKYQTSVVYRYARMPLIIRYSLLRVVDPKLVEI